MHLFDKEGNKKEITNLRKAMQQAQQFKGMKHEDPGFEAFDQQQNDYWTDIYEKLLLIKKGQKKNTRKK